MRKANREIKNFRELVQIIESCQVIRLAFNDGDYPYIVPLNYGYEIRGDYTSENASLETCQITLFFHGAMEGKKIDVMQRDNRCFFEMDGKHQVVTYGTDQPGGGHCTFMYESLMGKGHIEFEEEPEEKLRLLTLLTDRYHTEHFAFNQSAVGATKVFKLIIHEMTGKRRPDPR